MSANIQALRTDIQGYEQTIRTLTNAGEHHNQKIKNFMLESSQSTALIERLQREKSSLTTQLEEMATKLREAAEAHGEEPGPEMQNLNQELESWKKLSEQKMKEYREAADAKVKECEQSIQAKLEAKLASFFLYSNNSLADRDTYTQSAALQQAREKAEEAMASQSQEFDSEKSSLLRQLAEAKAKIATLSKDFTV